MARKEWAHNSWRGEAWSRGQPIRLSKMQQRKLDLQMTAHPFDSGRRHGRSSLFGLRRQHHIAVNSILNSNTRKTVHSLLSLLSLDLPAIVDDTAAGVRPSRILQNARCAPSMREGRTRLQRRAACLGAMQVAAVVGTYMGAGEEEVDAEVP